MLEDAQGAHDVSCDSESVVEALVREHLTRKQYTRTLAEWKNEQVGACCHEAMPAMGTCLS